MPNGDTHVHAAAIVEASVAGLSLQIGAFAIVETGAKLGEGCVLASHAIVRAGCELGAGSTVDSFAVLGGAPQVRAGAPASSRLTIGPRAQIREAVTINRASTADGCTIVGADCMFMANSHVAHDCRIGDRVTLANNVMLAGHVEIGDGTFVGGGAGVHQFVRIGQGVMIGGNASISYDVPPYVIAAERNQIHGLNLVGIRRSGMAGACLADLKRCYHAVYAGPGDVRERARLALADPTMGTSKPGRAFLTFFAGGRRGFARPRTRGESVLV
jgi:UDP-N-acetylglucosamine acyltransferase